MEKRQKEESGADKTTECTKRNKGAATSALGLLFKLLVEAVSGSFCRCHGLFRIGVNGYSCREYWRLIDKAEKLEAKNAIAFVAYFSNLIPLSGKVPSYWLDL